MKKTAFLMSLLVFAVANGSFAAALSCHGFCTNSSKNHCTWIRMEGTGVGEETIDAARPDGACPNDEKGYGRLVNVTCENGVDMAWPIDYPGVSEGVVQAGCSVDDARRVPAF